MAEIFLHGTQLPDSMANLTFIDDVPDGYLLQHSSCGKEIVVKDDTKECPECGGDLIYGRYDW